MSRFLLAVLLLCITPLCCVDHLWGQSIQVEQERLQRQVDELRRDVDDLRSIVSGLRRDIMRKGIPGISPERPKATEDATLRNRDQASQDTGKVKGQVCHAVGLFFDQIDKALRMSDGDNAEDFMRKAVATLNHELEKYRSYTQVRHVLTLAEGLAWDTYTAVEARYGTVGNADFMRAIEDYRKRYKAICKAKAD